MSTDNNTTEFNADELAFLSSKGEDSEALIRAYTKPPVLDDDDEDGGTPRHPGMEEEEKLNGAQKGENGQKAEDKESEEDADDENGSNGSKYVPHGQFHKERVRRQTAESEAAKLKVEMARAEERLAILNEFMQGGGQQQQQQNGQGGEQQQKSAWDEADIDPTEDFEGAMLQLRRRQQEDREARSEWQQKTEARAQESQQAQAYVQSAVAYAKQNPAFADAYRHLMQTYHQELAAYGMTDQAERNNHIKQEEKKLAKFALENGQNPAEVIMSLAQARGFALPQKEEQTNEKAPSLADAAKEVKGKVETIKKAKKSTGTLSNAGGGAKSGLTMEQMLSMSDDEFFEKVHKLPVSKRRNLIAGL